MRITGSRGLSARSALKLLATVAAAAMLGACSNSIERFGNAYNNPSDADPVYTASVPQKRNAVKRPTYQAPAPVESEIIEESPITRAPLPQKKAPSYTYEEEYKQAYKAPKRKPQLALPDEQVAEETVVEPILDEPAPRVKRTPSYAASENGSVRVEDGMTMYSIARANGVTVEQLAEANNISEPYNVMTGQRLVIPGRTTAEAPAKLPFKKAKTYRPAVEEPEFAPDVAVEEPVRTKPKRQTASGNTHEVGDGETLYSLGRKYGVSPFAIADANGLSNDQPLRLGQTLTIPAGGKTRIAAPKVAEVEAPEVTERESIVDEPEVKPKAKKKQAPLSLAEEEQAIGEEPQVAEVQQAPKAKPVEKTEEKLAEAPAAPSGSGLNLRWPVKGKVISGFGPKSNGLKNEGINIAVPEGTAIRAADDGVVAYAGSELKGYGNLVLIRHTGGYVTAYAHAKELVVKRGDSIKRGDIIAKAGQTGAVSSPQVHFEVRKGATALDPVKHLSSATAMN